MVNLNLQKADGQLTMKFVDCWEDESKSYGTDGHCKE